MHSFNQAVRVRSIVIQTDELSLAPKRLKLVVNRSNVGFDELEDAEEPDVAQVLELSEEEVKEGKQVALRFVTISEGQQLACAYTAFHFSFILIVYQIFVVSNHGGEDETRIDKIDVFGVPVEYVTLYPFYIMFTAVTFFFRTTKDLSGLHQDHDH